MNSNPAADRLEEALRGFLRDELGLTRELDRDEELLSMGLIASVEVAQVATFIEQQTGLTIPDRDIGARYFDSIGRILDYVSGLCR